MEDVEKTHPVELSKMALMMKKKQTMVVFVDVLDEIQFDVILLLVALAEVVAAEENVEMNKYFGKKNLNVDLNSAAIVVAMVEVDRNDN